MGNPYYIEPKTTAADWMGQNIRMIAMKQEADIAKDRSGLMREDLALRGRAQQTQEEQNRLVYGAGGFKERELGLMDAQRKTEARKLPVTTENFGPEDIKGTGEMLKQSGFDKPFKPLLDSMGNLANHPGFTKGKAYMFAKANWPQYQKMLVENTTAEIEKEVDPARKQLLSDFLGEIQKDSTGQTIDMMMPDVARQIHMENMEAAGKGKMPSSDIQEYNLYTQQAIASGQKPMSMLDYQTSLARAKAPSNNINIPVKVGEEGMTELGKEMGKTLVKERTNAEGAVTSLINLKDARKLLDEGMITGPGANFIVNFNNVLTSRLGFKNSQDPAENSKAYVAMMGNQVGQIIKQFGSGTGLSDADRAYAERIAGGDITVTEGTIRKILALNEKAYKNVIENYNKKARQAMKRPGAEALPYDLTLDVGDLLKDDGKPPMKW